MGFIAASVFWLIVSRAKPALADLRKGFRERREEAQSRKTSSVEENHRRNTLRRAQGMHLASQLFALDEIIQEPLLIIPPQRVEPGVTPKFEDIIDQTLPYLPSWPEIAGAYNSTCLTIPQALAGNSNIVIIGQPGIGKTVALAHLASLAANRSEQMGKNKHMVPFLVHVADLKLPITDPKDALVPILDSIAEHTPIFDLNKLPEFTKSMFSTGRALLLVDGFDEIPQEAQQVVTEYFKIINQNYPKTRIVTTGAPEYLDGLIPFGFAPMALAAWKPQTVEKFMHQWGVLWSQTIALETASAGVMDVDPFLLNTWLGSDNLTLSPLELTLKAWGAYAGDCLGPHVLESLATHIRRIAPVGTPIAALQTLAMQVTLSTQAVFDSRSAREWVRSYEVQDEQATENEGTTEDIPQDARPKTGQLKERKASTPSSSLLNKMTESGLLVSYQNNRMRFTHPVFAGYLAGNAVSDFNTIEAILNQSDWVGKFLAMRYFATYGDANKLVQTMLEFSRLPMHRPIFAAARWLRDAPTNTPWRGKLFTALAEIMQKEDLPMSLRGQAMAAFVYSNDPNAAKLFRQFAKSLSFELVQLAALGSGAMRDTKAINELENALNAPSLAVQRAACLALVSIGTNEALEVVAHALLNADQEVRRAAGEALASDEREGYAMLRDAIAMDDILVRRAAVYGLGRINQPWALELLEKYRIDDKEWVVRNSATEVLDARTEITDRAPRKLKAPSESPWLIEFASKQGMGVSPGVPATDVFLLALRGQELEYRLAAMPYLKFTPSESVLTGLYESMFTDEPELRETAYNTLWEMGAYGVKLPNPAQFGIG